MIEPTEVNHSRFPVEKVLLNNGDFSIVWGTWDRRVRCLGMRWNEVPNKVGFPVSNGKPVWFVIPSELSTPFLISLLSNKSANQIELLKVLQELQGSDALG